MPKDPQELTALLRRSDALNSACAAVEDWSAMPKAREEILAVPVPMRDETHETFERFREELGLSD